MKKTLSQKKEELEKLKKEVEEQERIEKLNAEKAEAEKYGMYTPLAFARVKINLYQRGERDFREIGDGQWYSVKALLGEPDLRKEQEVVLINTGDYQAWFPIPENDEYYEIDYNYFGMEDTDENREYLTNIKYK